MIEHTPLEMYFAFVFVPQEGPPRVFIMHSNTTMRLWKESKDKAIKRGIKEDRSLIHLRTDSTCFLNEIHGLSIPLCLQNSAIHCNRLQAV
jgi:hypothetical protein